MINIISTKFTTLIDNKETYGFTITGYDKYQTFCSEFQTISEFSVFVNAKTILSFLKKKYRNVYDKISEDGKFKFNNEILSVTELEGNNDEMIVLTKNMLKEYDIYVQNHISGPDYEKCPCSIIDFATKQYIGIINSDGYIMDACEDFLKDMDYSELMHLQYTYDVYISLNYITGNFFNNSKYPEPIEVYAKRLKSNQ